MLSTSNGQYKYQSLKNYLIGKIKSGEYPSGVQVASEPELCKKFNLSRNTTRQALQELEQEGYVYRIRGKGTFVKSNTPQQSRKIALLICDTTYMTYPVTVELIRGVDEILCQNGYALDILARKRTQEAEQIGKLTETYAGFLLEKEISHCEYQSFPCKLRHTAGYGIPYRHPYANRTCYQVTYPQTIHKCLCMLSFCINRR